MKTSAAETAGRAGRAVGVRCVRALFTEVHLVGVLDHENRTALRPDQVDSRMVSHLPRPRDKRK